MSRLFVRKFAVALFIWFCVAMPPAHAQESPPATTPSEPSPTDTVEDVPYDPQFALMSVVEPRLEVDPTSLSGLGDDYDPASGTVSFSVTDISLPGNFDIPVELRRWVPQDDYDTGGPNGWTWNIPFIRGNFLGVIPRHSESGWSWGYRTWHDGWNCTGSADTAVHDTGSNNEPVAGNAYWQGKLLHIPGAVSETFLDTAGGEQVTQSNFRISGCIGSGDNGGQQGIIVSGPNGLTYTFNQIKSYYNRKAALKDPVVYTRLLMVTTIKDRFGNQVNYGYDSAGDLTSIAATDGRTITIQYEVSDSIKRPLRVLAHGRTWTFGYAGTGTAHLSTVTLPDYSKWTYPDLSVVRFAPNGIEGGYNQTFSPTGQPIQIPGCTVDATTYNVVVKSPQGLSMAYTFKNVIQYRSAVDPEFYTDMYNPGRMISRSLYCIVKRSLVAKTAQGPGVGPHTWTYAYSKNRGSYTKESGLNPYLNADDPPELPMPAAGDYPESVNARGNTHVRSVTVSGPDQKTVFYIDRQFHSDSESRVIATDVLNAAGNQLLQRTESKFALGAYVGMHWYMCPCDGTPPINEHQLSHRIHETGSVVLRYHVGGIDRFTSTAQNFDGYGFAQESDESSSFSNNVRSVGKTWQHDAANSGLIGLPLTEVVNDALALEHHYNAQGQRDSTTSFGKLQQTLGYDNTATVASGQRGSLLTATDGNNHTTTFSNWKRGIPQSIVHPDGSTVTAVVNDHGWIDSITDETGSKTCYAYDPMGRVTQITYPSESISGACSSTVWTATTRSFTKTDTPLYGLAAGHWMQSTTTGNARREVYLDALWRPVLVREYDAGNVAGTERFTRTAYDEAGRVAFASYPSSSSAALTGTWMAYDALGRIEQVRQDSELDSPGGIPITTTTSYLAGFQIKTVDPKGNATTTGYQAFGQPSYDAPVRREAPDDIVTTIDRDVWGKPRTITRSGGGVTAVRHFFYDIHQRLCKTVEPERGAEFFHYDTASRVDWSASDTSLSRAPECDYLNVSPSQKVARMYDDRDRLTGVNYPDSATYDEIRSYYADGALKTAVRGPGKPNEVKWEYLYNKRRLQTEARIYIGGETSAMNWTYNGLGQVSGVRQLNGFRLDYAPNALGQPTKVYSPTRQLTYASAISYFPNGALNKFNYGNGVVHELAQNARQLPEHSWDAKNGVSVVDNRYTYDRNGNPTVIDDALNIDDKALGYDELDRLTSATGSFGSASMSYDALDNLMSYQVGTRNWTYQTDPATQRVTSVKDAGTGAIQVAFQYDGHGNVYRRTQGTFDRRFNYDKADRLVSVTTNAGAMVADHVYDSFGRRTRTDTPVSGISNKNLRFQIYTPGGEFQWENAITWNYNGTGGASTQINYISLGGTLIAKQIGKSTFTTDTGARMAEGTLGFNPFANPYEGATPGQADGTHGNAGGNGNGNAGGNGNGNAGGNGNGAGGNTDPNAVATAAVVSPETYSVEYVHTDALGSPVSYTSSTGSVLPGRRTLYEPYGTPTTTPRDGEPTYTGHQYDTSTGLIYAQHRYYDPALGRFLGPDPMAVDTISAFNWNRYAYANNNPYRFTDPDGRCPVESTKSTCIQSKIAPTSTRTATISSDLANAAVAGKSKVRVRSDSKTEKLGSINKQADGTLEVQLIPGVITVRTSTAFTASGTLPANAEAIIHGHPKVSGLKDERGTLGDAGALASSGRPNIAVGADGRMAAHELENGKYQVRAIEGAFTKSEIKHFEKQVDNRQEFFNAIEE